MSAEINEFFNMALKIRNIIKDNELQRANSSGCINVSNDDMNIVNEIRDKFYSLEYVESIIETLSHNTITIKTQERDIITFKSKLESLTIEVSTKNLTIQQLNDQIKILKKDNENLLNEKSSICHKASLTSRYYESSKKDISILQDIVEKMQFTATSLDEQLSKLNDLYEGSTIQVSTLRAELIDMKSKLESNTREYYDLLAKHQELLHENSSLRIKIVNNEEITSNRVSTDLVEINFVDCVRNFSNVDMKIGQLLQFQNSIEELRKSNKEIDKRILEVTTQSQFHENSVVKDDIQNETLTANSTVVGITRKRQLTENSSDLEVKGDSQIQLRQRKYEKNICVTCNKPAYGFMVICNCCNREMHSGCLRKQKSLGMSYDKITSKEFRCIDCDNVRSIDV